MNVKFISAKRIISHILTVTTLLLSITVFPVSAQAETTAGIEYTLYENTFDNGKADLKAASAEERFFENTFLTYDGVRGVWGDIETTTYIPDGEATANTAIRVGSGDWASGKTFFLDFTKHNAQSGIRSGIVRASFDFGIDGASTANAVRIGMNMIGADNVVHEGGRMMYFERETAENNASVFKYELAPSVGGWPGSSISGIVDTGSQHHLEIVMDFDEDTVIYYLDNAAIESDGEVVTQKLTGTVMNNFMVALGGIFEYFDNFKVTHEFRKPLECVIDSEMDAEHPGNVFFDDEQIDLNLNVKNRDDIAYSSVPVLITATDLNDNIIETTTVDVSADAFGSADFSVSLKLPAFGAYKLSVTSDMSLESTARVSRSVGNTANNPKVNVHMQLNGGKAKDTAKVFQLMDKAGLGGVRTDMGWSAVKNEDGTVTHSTGGDSYIDAAVAESKRTGVEILALMSTNSKDDVYPGDEDGGFNTTEGYLQGFYEYCNTVAKKYGDHIKWWELGNEDNYRRRNTGEYDEDGNAITEPDSGENYAKILLKGYQGIKDAYEDAIVLNAGSAVVLENDVNHQPQFAKGWLGAAQTDSENKYFDRFAVHSYHTGMPPEVRDRWNYNSEWTGYMAWVDKETFLKTHILKPFDFENVPTWVTETGYYANGTVYGDVRTEEIAAAYNIRLLLLNEINGFHEKIFFYNFMNEGFDLSDSEHNYGMLCRWTNEEWETRSAYAAKPQYLAVAQWNKLMSGAEYESCERNVDYSDSQFSGNDIITAPKDCYNAKFTSGEDVIHAVWDVFDNSGTITVNNTEYKKYAVIYDLYGNVTDVLQDAVAVEYDPGKVPAYMVFTDECPDGWGIEPEIMFYRDYEDYTGGDPFNQDKNGKEYGTWQISGDGRWEGYTKAESVNGNGFYVTDSHINDGIPAFPDIYDGMLYVAFDEIPGETPGETSIFYKSGTPNFAFSYKPGVAWTAADRNWSFDKTDHMYGSGKNYRIELVIDPATGDAKRYINGNYIGTKNIGITTGLTEMVVRFSNTSVVDNLTVIYYPENIIRPTFSLDSARLNSDNTISVFLKSDAVDSDGRGTDTKSAISAPYGITLLSTDETNTSYTLADDTFTVDGATVTGVTRGNAAGEYIISVSEALSADETYIVTAKNSIRDILGGGLSVNGMSATAGKQEFAVAAVETNGNKATVTYTNTTNSDKSFELLMAAYDKNGILKEIVSKSVNAKKASLGCTEDISLKQDITDKTVKVFLWNDALNIKPFN